MNQHAQSSSLTELPTFIDHNSENNPKTYLSESQTTTFETKGAILTILSVFRAWDVSYCWHQLWKLITKTCIQKFTCCGWMFKDFVRVPSPFRFGTRTLTDVWQILPILENLSHGLCRFILSDLVKHLNKGTIWLLLLSIYFKHYFTLKGRNTVCWHRKTWRYQFYVTTRC